MNKISKQDRQALIKLASSLPKGDETRRAILSSIVGKSPAQRAIKRMHADVLKAVKPYMNALDPSSREVYDIIRKFVDELYWRNSEEEDKWIEAQMERGYRGASDEKQD
jgi:hypothetical protein